jgi:hypothetical protein
MKITLEIEDNKAEALVAFLRTLDFVKVNEDEKFAEHGEYPDIE